VVVDLAKGMGIALPTLVATVEEAEVAWFRDPVDALALGARAAPRSAPEGPGLPEKWADPTRRFAPVGAVARVIVAGAREPEGRVPTSLQKLADPRLKGKVILPRMDRREGVRLLAALELAYGERGVEGWLAKLAANEPLRAQTDEEVVARVAAGEAPIGLSDSLAAGARREAIRIVFPDQKGAGAIVVPTALVVLPGAGAAARRFSAWLVGPDAERMLAERAPGLLPLREGASAPAGLVPAWRLSVLDLDWSALAEQVPRWEQRLSRIPRPFLPVK
jgi:ABC-type Fe3+ transport system substrate-binding protein